jgi:hypothetical protein
MSWQDRLRVASADFQRAAWPQIRKTFPWAKEVVCAELEGLNSTAAGLLDRQGGSTGSYLMDAASRRCQPECSTWSLRRPSR